MLRTDEANDILLVPVIRYIFLVSYSIQYFLTPSILVKTPPNKISNITNYHYSNNYFPHYYNTAVWRGRP